MLQRDQNENAMSSLDYAPLDKINKGYDVHDGLIAIDEDDYNHNGLVNLNTITMTASLTSTMTATALLASIVTASLASIVTASSASNVTTSSVMFLSVTCLIPRRWEACPPCRNPIPSDIS